MCFAINIGVKKLIDVSDNIGTTLRGKYNRHSNGTCLPNKSHKMLYKCMVVDSDKCNIDDVIKFFNLSCATVLR